MSRCTDHRYASDKAYVVRLANKLRVPTPNTVIVGSADEALAVGNTLSLPVVIKPARSRVRNGSNWLSTSVSYATDLVMLRRILTRLPPAAYPVLLQERIEGPGRGLFACFVLGQPVAFFAHQRLREKPPSGGVSVLCESTPLDPAAVEYGTRLLSHIGWHGVAMVEFKQDNRDGSLRLMEINARFWGSLQLAIDAGVNFPCMLADIAAGKPPTKEKPYRFGIRNRWLAGDVDALIMLLTRSSRALNLPPCHPGRLVTLGRFLRCGIGIHTMRSSASTTQTYATGVAPPPAGQLIPCGRHRRDATQIRSQPGRACFQPAENLSCRLFIESIGIGYLDGTVVHRAQPN